MLLNERYQLEKQIGEGGENIVYLGTDLHNDQSVIIKRGKNTLHGEQRQQWLDEINFLRQIHLSGVVSYIDSFIGTVELTEYGYIVQEFIEGTSLKDEAHSKRYNQDQVKTIVEDILEILVQLQELTPPIIHRDLKPANIIRRASDGKLFFIDFGLAMNHVHNDTGHTMATGTLGYQSPEQITGYPTPSSDVYSVGVIALELLSRRNPKDMLWGQRLSWESSVITVRQEWKQWLKTALADEEERFSIAQEALDALRGQSAKPRTPFRAQSDSVSVPIEKPPLISSPPPITPSYLPPTSKPPPRRKQHQTSVAPSRKTGLSQEELQQRLQRYTIVSIMSFFLGWSFFVIIPFLLFQHLQNEVANNRLDNAQKVVNVLSRWWGLILFFPFFFACIFGVFAGFLGVLTEL